MHTLLFFDPGHFHAALTLRSQNPRIDPVIHVYAPAGRDLDDFLALVRSFNTRSHAPTAWDVRVHLSEHALDQLISDRLGSIVILAGKNGPRLPVMRRLHDAGFSILADKPWITTTTALPDLDQVMTGLPLAIDIMTMRHDIMARLRQRIVSTPSVFGSLAADSSSRPAIEIGSVHHLFKIVNGVPLIRPPWFYDVRIQGDGLVDIQSHVTDQAQWLIAPDHAYDYDRDVVIEQARRWSTPVPLSLFQESTNTGAFPEELIKNVSDDVLDLACNGEIDYRLCGIPVRQRAEWAQREPKGGGDLHAATVRGTQATIILRHGPKTGYATELHLSPKRDDGFETRLRSAVGDWQADFPGLDIATSDIGFRMVIPNGLDGGHETHFAIVLDEFLDHIEAGSWPQTLAARIRTRYTLLARAWEIANQ